MNGYKMAKGRYLYEKKDEWNEKCGNGCDGDRNFECVYK